MNQPLKATKPGKQKPELNVSRLSADHTIHIFKDWHFTGPERVLLPPQVPSGTRHGLSLFSDVPSCPSLLLLSGREAAFHPRGGRRSPHWVPACFLQGPGAWPLWTEPSRGLTLRPGPWPDLHECPVKLEAVALLQAGGLVAGEAQWLAQAHSARTLLQPENGPRVPGATPPRLPSAAHCPVCVSTAPRPWEHPGRRNHFVSFVHSESARGG